MIELSKNIKELSKKCSYYEDLYEIFWKLHENKKVKESHYKSVSVGLFNIPCGGFGDIIVCKTMYDYLQQWYPGMKVSICTTSPEKYNDLGIKGTIHKLSSKDDHEGECRKFEQVVLKKRIKFDIMIIVPIINQTFEIKKFQKLIPYANVSNTFTMSEYNGEYGPYTFPIGVGEGQLGLLFNDFPIKQQTLIKKPYAMVYIQPQPEWGIHSKYCFLSYIEMICNKYRSRHPRFQVIVPDWISVGLLDDSNLYYRFRKIISKFYGKITIIVSDGETEEYELNKTDKSEIIIRGDILPQQRNIFISLMKDSINDILVTGDQSITDVMSCCKRKNIWYQIAPWKRGFADNLSKHLPNRYLESFKTSCGTLRSLRSDIDWKQFLKGSDFRIHGRKRMDAILQSVDSMKQEKLLQTLLHITEHSRYLETAQEKISKL